MSMAEAGVHPEIPAKTSPLLFGEGIFSPSENPAAISRREFMGLVGGGIAQALIGADLGSAAAFFDALAQDAKSPLEIPQVTPEQAPEAQAPRIKLDRGNVEIRGGAIGGPTSVDELKDFGIQALRAEWVTKNADGTTTDLLNKWAQENNFNPDENSKYAMYLFNDAKEITHTPIFVVKDRAGDRYLILTQTNENGADRQVREIISPSSVGADDIELGLTTGSFAQSLHYITVSKTTGLTSVVRYATDWDRAPVADPTKAIRREFFEPVSVAQTPFAGLTVEITYDAKNPDPLNPSFLWVNTKRESIAVINNEAHGLGWLGADWNKSLTQSQKITLSNWLTLHQTTDYGFILTTSIDGKSTLAYLGNKGNAPLEVKMPNDLTNPAWDLQTQKLSATGKDGIKYIFDTKDKAWKTAKGEVKQNTVELLNPNSTLDLLRYPSDQTPLGVHRLTEGFNDNIITNLQLNVGVIESVKQYSDNTVRVDFRFLDKQTGVLYSVKGAKYGGTKDAPLFRTNFPVNGVDGVWRPITEISPNTAAIIYLGLQDYDKMVNGQHNEITFKFAISWDSFTMQKRIENLAK